MGFDGRYTVGGYGRNFNATPDEYPLAVWFSRKQQSYNFHEHDSMEVAVVAAGSGAHLFSNRKAAIRQGDVLVIPPGIRHAYESGSENFSIFNVMYDCDRLPIPVLDAAELPLFYDFFPFRTQIEKTFSPEPLLHLGTPALLRQVTDLLEAIDHELKSQNGGNMFGALTHFLELLLTLLRCGPAVQKDGKRKAFQLGEVLKYVHTNFTQDIPMEVLIRKACLSQRRFQFKFRETTGYTVTDYVNRLRIERALQLMREQDLTAGQLAELCGFNSANYFIRKFRAVTGISPAEYSRKLDAGTSESISAWIGGGGGYLVEDQ